MTPSKTPFAGYERLGPGDPLSSDGWYFVSRNPLLADRLGRLGAVTHRHDAHPALADPALAPVVATAASGGSIPSRTPIYVTYTLLDNDGGETLPAAPVVVTTPAGFADPIAAPAAAVDHAAGSLLAGSYSYAVTVADGLGGETAIGPANIATVDPGFPNSEVHLTGLVAILAAASGGAVGAYWRLWRSQGGSAWYLIGTGTADSLVDNGIAGDCTVFPPAQNTTRGANSLDVTIPAGQPAAAVQYRVYASVDGSFSSPALLASYAIADAGTLHTFTDLTLADGIPPAVSTCYPGANQINPDTDILGWTWKRPVADAASLPAVGNTDGDTRVTLDTHTIYVWDDTAGVWTGVGGGGGGSPTTPSVINLLDHGVVNDGVIGTNGSITHGTADLQDPGAAWSPADVGKIIAVHGALAIGPDHNTLVTTISAYVSPTHVVLAANADTDVVGGSYIYGTDNGSYAYLRTPQGNPIFAPPGLYLSTQTLTIGGNELYGVRDRSVFVTLAAVDCIQIANFYPEVSTGHNLLAPSSKLYDVVPSTALNWSSWITSAAAAPASAYAVRVSSWTPARDIPPQHFIEINSPRGQTGWFPQPCFGGIYADNAPDSEITIHGAIIAQDGYGLVCNNVQGRIVVDADIVQQNVLGHGNQDVLINGGIVRARVLGGDRTGGTGILLAGSIDVVVSESDVNRIVVAAAVSRFRLRDNKCEGSTITVNVGASDHYVITGNDCRGNAIVDGGTGVNKVVANNI